MKNSYNSLDVNKQDRVKNIAEGERFHPGDQKPESLVQIQLQDLCGKKNTYKEMAQWKSHQHLAELGNQTKPKQSASSCNHVEWQPFWTN